MDGDDDSPFLFTDQMETWLETALVYGISEFDFWNMTIAEIKRAVEAKQKVEKLELKQKAIYDYKLANLITIGFANRLPDIWEMYPTLFDSEEEIQKREQKQAELSALRFINFAESFNKRFMEATK
jgi:hypothetical protein